MKRKMFKLMSVMFALLFCSTMVILSLSKDAYAFNLPDTGQTTCYDGAGNVLSPCPAPGQPLAQDGSYSINPLSCTNNGDGTVTDNNTGLIWQKEDDGTARTWDAAGSYCASLSTDWRLPTKKELMSIVDYSIPYPGPTINSIFTNTKQSNYWSSTTHAGYPSYAWYVNFSVGGVDSYGKDYYGSDYYVRCVRGGQPTTSFTDNGNGTVTDAKTGLMWQQGEPGYMTWPDALNYCESLTLPSGGQSDWRLPNIKELESITDDMRYSPASDTAYFPNAVASNYWSSTTGAYYPDFAWVVGYDGGVYGINGKDDGNDYYVRCVRSGQGGGSFGNLVISPASFDFGTVIPGQCSASQEFTLTNTGAGTLHVADMSVPDSGDFALIMTGDSNPCNVKNPTLAPGASCTLITAYCPTAVGSANTNMYVTSDDPVNPTVAVLFTGTASNIKGWVVVIDGITPVSTFISSWSGWPSGPSMYLYDAINQDWRNAIEKVKGILVPFSWSGDALHDTDKSVQELYLKLKQLNQKDVPVVILAHSWGTVLAFKTLSLHSDIRVDKLITMGSPISSVTAPLKKWTKGQLSPANASRKPSNLNVWHNYFTACDLIAGGIGPANTNYKNTTVYRNIIGLPDPLACHSSYYEDIGNWTQILSDVIKK